MFKSALSPNLGVGTADLGKLRRRRPGCIEEALEFIVEIFVRELLPDIPRLKDELGRSGVCSSDEGIATKTNVSLRKDGQNGFRHIWTGLGGVEREEQSGRRAAPSSTEHLPLRHPRWGDGYLISRHPPALPGCACRSGLELVNNVRCR